MSKTIPIALAAHQQLGSTSIGYLLRLERTDGVIVGLTSDSESLTLAGVFYDAGGLDVTSIVTKLGLSVDGAEFSTLNNETLFLNADIQSGIWRNAKFLISKYNFRSPSDGTEPIMAGTMGGLRVLDNRVVAEFRGLQQYLQQTVAEVTSKTCRARFGDARCTKDLGPLTFTAAVTAVTSQQVFTASALGQAADYFGNGEFTWLTGGNAGLTVGVKSFASGVITLMLPMLVVVQVGDTFSVVKGCRKRLEDCKANDNILNFQGEPHLPGMDALTGAP